MAPRLRVEEGGLGEVGGPVDGEEHDEFTLGEAQFAGVDVDVTDGGLREAAPPVPFAWVAAEAV